LSVLKEPLFVLLSSMIVVLAARLARASSFAGRLLMLGCRVGTGK